MQVIWSRAAQTRSCRCTSCLHNATTVVRRATSAAGRRRLKASDVFTACYSAMFATAAVMDAKHKDNRRKQWDIAIADVRAGLDSGRDQDSSTLDTAASKAGANNRASREVDDRRTQSVIGAIERIVNSSTAGCSPQAIVNWNPIREGQETQLDTQLRILSSRLRNAPPVRKPQPIDKEDPPLSAGGAHRASQSRTYFKEREPRTEVHLRHMEHMVAGLVTRLLLGTKRFALDNNFLTVVPIKTPIDSLNREFNDIAHRMVSLQASTTGLPTYSISTTEVRMDRNELNDSVTAIISARLSDQRCIDLMVAKLCYNLLVSTSAPNVHTYTTMIVHFTRLKQHHLAQAVIDSFFNHSKFAPNPWTVSAILDHYAVTGDGTGFRSVIRRMRGVDGDMRVKRLPLSVMSEARFQSLALQSKVIHRNGSLHWKLPRNELIFKSLIRGSLHLFGVRRAVVYFKAALREGWQLTSDLFIEIAKACLAERNKKASMALLAALISQWQNRKALALECDAASRGLIHQLMHFCGIDHLTSSEGHQKPPLDLVKLDLNGWLCEVRIEDIKEKVKRSAETLSQLNTILTISSSREDKNPQRIIANMLDYLRWKSQKARRSLIAGKYTAVAASAARLADLEEQLLFTIYEALSPPSKHIYNTKIEHLPCSMSVFDKLKIALDLRRAASPILPTAQAHALGIRSPTELLTQDASLPVSENSLAPKIPAATSKSAPPAAVDGEWVQDGSIIPNTSEPIVRPGSFPPLQLKVPPPWSEAIPARYAILRL